MTSLYICENSTNLEDKLPKPIPLHCRNNAGTGFLATDGLSVWLTTCVHIVTGIDNTPPLLSYFSNAYLCIVSTNLTIPLFAGGVHRFSVITNTTTSALVDALAIKLSDSEIANLKHFGVYDIKSIPRVDIGDTVIAKGYPGMQHDVIPVVTLRAEVTIINGLDFALSKPGESGLSGGPVTKDNTLVGIIRGDIGKKPNMESAIVVYLDVIREKLFV